MKALKGLITTEMTRTSLTPLWGSTLELRLVFNWRQDLDDDDFVGTLEQGGGGNNSYNSKLISIIFSLELKIVVFSKAANIELSQGTVEVYGTNHFGERVTFYSRRPM